jgi:NADH-quinone oxidoreductase subunit N
MSLGPFIFILPMRRSDGMVEGIYRLAGLARTHPGRAAAMAVFMFSLAGIPPLAGFFAKLYVFMAAIDAGLYSLAVIGVVTSVVGAYYYLRIVKVMYFDEPAAAFEPALGTGMNVLLVATAGATLLFFLLPGPLVTSAEVAAQALFQ